MAGLVEISRRLSRLPILLASASLFALMVMTFADVVLRSAFNSPIEAATELTRILMAVMVFSVLPVLSVAKDHIEVDLAEPLFSSELSKRIRTGLIFLACGGMLILPAGKVISLAERARSYGDLTEYLNIPQFYVAWFIAIMAHLTAAVLILRGCLVLLGCFKPNSARD
ncbi:MAG: TRAP transporter small permease subunit [Albidovulum sp.]|nr:TRAP transporter small permease subunit [Albidovulum sp.]